MTLKHTEGCLWLLHPLQSADIFLYQGKKLRAISKLKELHASGAIVIDPASINQIDDVLDRAGPISSITSIKIWNLYRLTKPEHRDAFAAFMSIRSCICRMTTDCGINSLFNRDGRIPVVRLSNAKANMLSKKFLWQIESIGLHVRSQATAARIMTKFIFRFFDTFDALKMTVSVSCWSGTIFIDQRPSSFRYNGPKSLEAVIRNAVADKLGVHIPLKEPFRNRKKTAYA